MKSATKLIIVAILALATGVAYAAPLLTTPVNVQPLPRVPQGPKADFAVSVAYANFSYVDWQMTETHNNTITGKNITQTYPYTNVTYTVVLNVTNLSDKAAKIYEITFAAADNITIANSSLGGFSFNRGLIDPGVSSGGVVDSVWLDGNWINVTWIPGTNYPFNLFTILTPHHPTQTTIPQLPENASEIGTWLEGVPIAEYFDSTKLVKTEMYINGSWVDVTGRVSPGQPQPMVMATNTLVNQVLPLGVQPYRNTGNVSVGPVTELPSWHTYNTNGPTYRWDNLTGFNNTWAPYESRLIVFTNTQMFGATSGIPNLGVASLQTGKISLYAAASSYLNNWPVNGTYYNTISTATSITQLTLDTTPNGYVYNGVLTDNQTFQLDQYGVEAYLKRSDP